jgi:hypothetical protein
MANFSLGSISNRAYNSLNDVPTSISGAVLTELAYQALLYSNNVLHRSTGSNSIPDDQQSPIINLTKAFALARMANVGVNADWSLGELSVSEGTQSTEAQQVKTWLDTAMMEMKFIPPPLRWSKANG